VDALGIGPDDEVLEIGPGRGALTGHLTGRAGRLVVIELDDDLAATMAERYAGDPSVEVVHGDVLDVPYEEYLEDPARVFVLGNIPYNITTPIIFRLLRRPRPHDILLMVQEEVADRLVAAIGSKAYGALSVGVRSVAMVRKLFRVRRGSFRPVPGVDSAIVRITPHRPDSLTLDEERQLRLLVRSAFQWRRKQLGKILRDHPELRVPVDQVEAVAAETGIALTDRPERISPEAFIGLSAALSAVSQE
jgi:16S rRNA (adenine1518-N6/adenine1519-N6)-dimethyltransferase